MDGQAFERLVTLRIFVPVAAPTAGISKEFIRYRTILEHADVKQAVEKYGKTNLKKWFTKAKAK